MHHENTAAMGKRLVDIYDSIMKRRKLFLWHGEVTRGVFLSPKKGRLDMEGREG